MPAIPESDVLEVMHLYDALPPERQGEAKQLLERYRTQQADLGDTLFPSLAKREEEDVTRFRSVFEDIKNVDTVSPSMAAIVPYLTDPDDGRKHTANVMFLARRLGKTEDEVNKSYPFYSRAYAKEVWKEPGELDTKAFYGKAAHEVSFEKANEDAAHEAMKAGARAALSLSDASPMAAIKEAQESNWTPDQQDAFLKGYNGMTQRFGHNRTMARGLFNAIERDMNGAARPKDGAEINRARETILDLVPAQRAAVLQALVMAGKSAGDSSDKSGVLGWFQQAGESGGRFLVGMATDTASTERTIQQTPDSGTIYSLKLKSITTPEDARAYVSEQLGRMQSERLNDMQPNPYPLPSGDAIELSPEASALVRQAKERALKEVSVSRQLRAIAESADPVKSISASAFGTTAAAIGITALSRGTSLPLMAQGYSNIVYDELSLQYEDMSPEDKGAISGLSGGIQAGLDLVGFKVWDKLPGLKSLLGQGITKELVKRFAGRIVIKQFEQTGVEIAQDYTTALVHEAIAAVKKDVPAHDWDKETPFLTSAGNNFVAMLGLTFLGVGHSSVLEYAGAREMLSNNQTLGMAGLQEADRVRVIDLASAGQLEDAQTALQEAWPRRSLDVAREFNEAGKQDAGPDGPPDEVGVTVTRSAQGWVVSDGKGGSTTVDSAQAAAELRGTLQLAASQEEAEALVSVLDDFHNATPEGVKRETVLTGENVSTQGEKLYASRGAGEVREITSGSMLDSVRAQVVAMGNPVDVVVNGSNDVFRENVGEAAQAIVQRLTINNSAQQAPIVTVLHEIMEANLKAGQLGQVISVKDAMNAIGRVADILPVEGAQRRLDALKERGASAAMLAEAEADVAFRGRVQRVASGEGNETEMREVAVEIAIADVLERDRSGRRTGFRAGSISQALNQAAMSAVNQEEAAAIGKLRALLRSVKAWLRGVLGTVARIKRAKAEGLLSDGDALGSFVDKLLGLEHSKYARAVEGETAAMLGESHSVKPLGRIHGVASVHVGGASFWNRPALFRDRSERFAYEFKPGDLIGRLALEEGRVFEVESVKEDNAGASRMFVKTTDGSTWHLDAGARYLLHGNSGNLRGEAQRAIHREADARARLSRAITEAEAKARSVQDQSEGQESGHATGSAAEGEAAKDGFTLKGRADSLSFSLRAKWPDVWRGFPDVQFLGNTNLLTTKGGTQIAVPEFKWKVNEDWYVAKGHSGLGVPTHAQQEQAAHDLISRLAAANPERAAAMLAFIKQHPNAILAPVRGIERPNKAANIIPEQFARRLAAAVGNPVDETFQKLNTEANTGKSAEDRLLQRHWFSGEIKPGAEYILVDDVSTTGATAYYAARYIEANGGNLVGVVQLGLTPRLKGEGKFSPKQYAGDEQRLEMSEATREALRKRGDDATLNAVVQNLGIAHDWHELTDALGRALAANWRRAGAMSESGPTGSGTVQQDATGGSVAGNAQALPAFAPSGEVGTPPSTAREQQATFGFSLSPARRIEAVAHRLQAIMDSKPEGSRQFLQKATENLRALRNRWADLPEKVGKGDLDKQQARYTEQRREEIEEKLVAEVERDTGGIAHMPELAKLTEHPLADFLRTSASRRKRYYAWRLESPAKWRRRQIERLQQGGTGESVGGDYDGADALPGIWFQGSEAPDTLAMEAHGLHLIKDSTPDALWEGISAMLSEVATNRERLLYAQDRLREARKTARDEAALDGKAWRHERDMEQARLGSPREAATRDLAALEAMTMALPAEVRERLPSGYASLASISTDEAFDKEMQKRIRQIDKALDQHWRKKNLESLDRLLAQGQGKREGGKIPLGVAGVEVHRYFEYVAQVATMAPPDLVGERAKVEAGLEVAAGSDAEMQWIEKQQILDEWGGFADLHPAAQSDALDAGWDFYQTGRSEWLRSERERIKLQRENSGKLVDQIGQGLYTKLGKRQSIAGTVGSLEVEFRDFEGVLRALLGDNHPLVKRWAGAVSRGYGGKEDGMRALRGRWQAMLDAAMPGRGRNQQRRRLYDMRTVRNIEVDIEEDKADPRKSSEEKQREAEAGVFPDKINNKVKITEDEAIFLTMTARQSQYVQPLAMAGWTPPVLSHIEASISPEGKMIRGWMAREYDTGHAPLAAVFARVRGIKLPKIPNYSPGRFYNWGNEKPLDVMGTGTVNGGFANGFLIDRKAHFSQVKLASALGVFWTHQNESLHWQNLAEIVREMRGSMRNPDVKRAIEGAWGQEGTQLMESWMLAIEGNGIRINAGAFDKAISKATSIFAIGKLAYNAGTIVKQSMAILNTSLDEAPFGIWLMGAGEVFRHPSRFTDVYNSPVIRRRLENGYSPEVRMLLDSFWTSKPGRSLAAMEKGMEFLGFADAFFTSISAAVTYETHATLAERAGMTAEQAHIVGMEKMEEAVQRTAQPQTADRRSMVEHRQSALGKLGMLFMTEARQKGSIWAEALRNVIRGKATRKDVKNLVLSHLILSPMMAAIGAAIRDFRDGPDDGEDDKAWELSDFVISAILGPLSQVPVFGQITDAVKDKVAGRRRGGKGSNVLADPVMAVFGGLYDLAFGDDEIDSESVLRIMSEVGGAPGVGANILKQAGDVVDQVSGGK